MKTALYFGAILAAMLAPPGAFAFTQTPDDGFMSRALDTKIQDPEDIVSHFDGRPTAGKTFSLGKNSTFSLQLTGPRGYDPGADSGPFVRDPAANTVPSKRQGW